MASTRSRRHVWAAPAQKPRAFDGIADAVLVADANSHYVDANEAAVRLLGYSIEELMSMSVADVVAQEPASTLAEYNRYVKAGRWDGEVELRRKDGEVLFLYARARVINLPAGVAYVSVLTPRT